MKKSRKQEKTRNAHIIQAMEPEAKAKQKAETKSGVPGEGTDDNGRIDYGGLPDRDLKKNLGGCG